MDSKRNFNPMLAAGLSVFIALTNALEERRYDLAVMRMLGAGRGKLFGLLVLEGLMLALLGAALCATGRSRVQNAEMIDRGYERVEQKLTALGARIKRVA